MNDFHLDAATRMADSWLFQADGIAHRRKADMPAKTVVDRARVRQLLSQGMTHRQICVRLGINKSSVLHVSRELKKEGISPFRGDN